MGELIKSDRALAGLLCVSLLLQSCGGTNVRPLTESGAQVGVDEDEIKLLDESRHAVEELERRGLVDSDADLQAYLDSVLQRLNPPELSGGIDIRVHALRDPVVNAVAFPDGNIYINTGLLERLDSEAQLAHVLAHELAHVVQRHGLSGYKSRKATRIAAHITDLMLLGTSIAYVPYIAAMSSHSRGHEREADEIALRLMSDAGYPLSGADSLFHVISEVKVEESVGTSIYSSHPDNSFRSAYTRKLIESGELDTNEGASDNAEQYAAYRDRLHTQIIRMRLQYKHYELARDSAVRAAGKDPSNPWYAYYRGESYRLMGEDPKGAAREHAHLYDERYGDALVETMTGSGEEFRDAAVTAYNDALSLEPGFAHAYRGLGLVAYSQDRYADALVDLRYYLDHADPVEDRRYIQRLIAKMEVN